MSGSWSVHKLDGTLGGFAAQWDQLNAREFGSHPLLDSRFVNGLLEHFSQGQEWVAVCLANDQATAMCIVTPRRAGVWQTFVPSQAQIAPALVKDAGLARRLVAKLPGAVGVLDLLCQDPALSTPATGPWYHSSCKPHALTISIPLRGGFENYWATRAKKLASNLRRYERRAAADFSEVRFSQIKSAAEMSAAVARYAALESSGWKGAQGTALTPDNEQGRFYTELLESYAARGGADVFELWFDQVLVASRLVIRGGNTVVLLKTTYAEPFAKHAPGRLLLKRAIEQMFGDYAEQTLEFYTDADHELLAWAAQSRIIGHVSLYRNVVAAMAYHLLHLKQNVRARRGTAEPSSENEAAASQFSGADSAQMPLLDGEPK